MTKKQQARLRVITTELANMSKNGWRNALPSDYLPLEAEWRELQDLKTRAGLRGPRRRLRP